MRWYSKIVVAGLCAGLQACVTPPAVAPTPPAASASQAARTPVTILISIDGFRADYLQRGVTPNLSALAAAGISAAMRPSFPSKTFPNHWTIVTGERPDRNGIVSNSMEDARRPGETFTMATDDPFWWNEAKPLWVDAEQAGIRTGTVFWPGANVAWGGAVKPNSHGATTGGTRPEDWMQFNQAVTGEQRVNGVLDWMRRPAAIRPRFVTLYFDTVDSAGHEFGPDDPRTTAAAGAVDALIGKLVAGLRELGQPANLVIVADHGMAAISSERMIAIDRIANPADYRIFETGPFASLSAVPGHEAALEKALLAHHDHLQCWRKSDIPARFHYGSNPRIQPYFCLAEPGWETAKTTPDKPRTGGDHGYDNMAPEMRALFVASGPAIKPLGTLPPFDNVDVYPLLRDLLGLPPASGVDGDDTPFRAALKR
ncbi:ectonucleotide pyrophosphatase/phosphodiesterase [Sphingomonas sp. NFR15]|uniref:alkaline phosphatase family protein n=1 Tax=Sphingomonas sp. NFR15 TaxID=1566282 RepID=UPI00088E65C3|nr:ectonucleotide pyrophosphatase/phosphodiesterase [Sphingomonas sp. NFR15]SDA11416.1 Predicted pyrophosphatase or phosphodiesterase, AlkP superfamily [Sphingomonas sp. NFR15]